MAQDKPTSHIGGLALAGGRSVRFGSEKAVAVLRGRPLLDWALDHLGRVAQARAVSARAQSGAARLAEAAGFVVLPDADEDAAGPLAGVRAGLIWAQHRGLDLLAVEACDTPLLPPDLHSRLVAGLGAAPAAFAQGPGGPEPLCAVWRVQALPAVAAALADGAHPPIWRLLTELGAQSVRFDEAEPFANANRLDDLQAAAHRLD